MSSPSGDYDGRPPIGAYAPGDPDGEGYPAGPWPNQSPPAGQQYGYRPTLSRGPDRSAAIFLAIKIGTAVVALLTAVIMVVALTH